MVRRTSWWALARSVIVVGGLGFAGAALASACLDHYAEDWGCEAAPAGSAGSGEGSAAVPASTADCGAAAATGDAGTGSGSGSAAMP